jgi:hypothetical protein
MPESYTNMLSSARGWILVSAESIRFHIIVHVHGSELGQMQTGKWFSRCLEVCFSNCRNYWPGLILYLNVISANVGFGTPALRNVWSESDIEVKLNFPRVWFVYLSLKMTD